MTPAKLSTVSKTENDTRLLDALRATPDAQKALARHETAAVERRAALVAEIEKLDKAAARELPPLQAAVQAALAEFEAARNSMHANFYNLPKRAEASAAGILAQNKIGEAQYACTLAGVAYSTRRDALERELRETANPAIKLFKSEMLKVFDAARHTQPATHSSPKRNPVTREVFEEIATNVKSIRARCKAAREAMDAADAMMLEADQRDVEMRLENLRQSLPAINDGEMEITILRSPVFLPSKRAELSAEIVKRKSMVSK